MRLGLHSPDGDQGFPGTLDLTVTYSVVPGVVRIDYAATSNADTVVSLTNHTYFNLDGESPGPVDAHRLTVSADAFTPVDDELIPTGENRDVTRNALRPATPCPHRGGPGSRRRTAHPRPGLRPQPRRDPDGPSPRRNPAWELRPHPGDHQ